jgi:hypothetical protein
MMLQWLRRLTVSLAHRRDVLVEVRKLVEVRVPIEPNYRLAKSFRDDSRKDNKAGNPDWYPVRIHRCNIVIFISFCMILLYLY